MFCLDNMLDLLHNYIMPSFVVLFEFHYALPKQILQDLFHIYNMQNFAM
jgi:hypothetical protein